jgi:hypothetical protein
MFDLILKMKIFLALLDRLPGFYETRNATSLEVSDRSLRIQLERYAWSTSLTTAKG